MSNGEMLQAFYLALAFCAAQRLRCASAIFLRASALNTRFFLGLALAGAFLALLPALVVVVPMLASSLRACESLAISESIWAIMFSIAINARIIQKIKSGTGFCNVFSLPMTAFPGIASFLGIL